MASLTLSGVGLALFPLGHLSLRPLAVPEMILMLKSHVSSPKSQVSGNFLLYLDHPINNMGRGT